MAAASTVPDSTTLRRTTDPTTVWDRIWREPPDPARDDALLARERGGPRWAAIRRTLRAEFGCVEGLRTIELGSGRGDLSVLLAEQGARVTLLDSSATALDRARDRFDRLGLPASCVQADMFDVAVDTANRFEVAVSSGVIEHFSGRRRTDAIAAHRHVLRAGGVALISVPHAACVPYRVWKWILEARGRWPYGFERPYSKGELARRARAVGLVDIEVHGMALWHSISSHWVRGLLRLNVDWANHPSRFDNLMGLIALLTGRKPVCGKVRRYLCPSAAPGPSPVVHSSWNDFTTLDNPPNTDNGQRTAGHGQLATDKPIAGSRSTISTLVDKHFRRRGHGVEFDMEARWVRRFLPTSAAPVLEIGCGIGALFEIMGTRRMIGLDHSEEGLRLTRRRFPAVPLVCAAADAIPLRMECAGAVVAQHVIEHLDAPDAALREWFRMLRPGGRLLVLTPNAAFRDPWIFHDESHIHLFEANGLVRAVQGAGFHIIDVRTLGLGVGRRHPRAPLAWRIRRFVTGRAEVLSRLPGLSRRGQTLCCAAVRPKSL